MRRLKGLLSNDSGELLAENLVSLLMVTGVAVAAAGFYIPTGAAVSTAAQSTSRTIMLKTTLSEQVPRLDSIGAGTTTVTGTISGKEVPVVLWREQVDGTEVLAGTVAKRFDDGADLCTGPATVDDHSCISARIPVPASAPDVNELRIEPGAGGTLATTVVPAGVTEVRYVFKAAASTADARVIFNAGAGDVTVEVATGPPGYYFGRLLVDPGSTITVAGGAGAVVDAGTLMMYEAPNA